MTTGNTDNADTRGALAGFQQQRGLTLRQLAQRLGKNEGYVSKYLNGVGEGDIAAFEARIRDMLARESRRRTWASVYFSTDAVEACYTAFDLVREASDIGLLTGPAGIGKSVAVQQYTDEHRTVIGFTATEGCGSQYDVQRGIASRLDMRRFNPRAARLGDYLREKLDGSERLVIIDNAQRIFLSGLRWIMDFHDLTGVSFCLVGNPEVMTKLAGRDQLVSRIGIREDISEALGKPDWLDKAADGMVAAMWPSARAEIAILARETARKPGHLRTLSKQLKIGIRLSETPAYKGKLAKAFVAARHLIGADSEEE
jgi:DNA transposition AAA+ family ATPase